MTAAPLDGRRAQAARNDEKILDSARTVFVADPGAPIAAVAEHAGVGIGALYRRYGSKEELLCRLCADGLGVYLDAARAALEVIEGGGDVAAAFAGFLRQVVDADTHSLTVNLAGRFTPTPQLHDDAARAGVLTAAVVEGAHEAGALRPEVTATDLPMLFEQLAVVRGADEERTRVLRGRYLALLLDALRGNGEQHPLPGPPPAPGELSARWTPSGG